MKISFLMLAHKNPNQINHLLELLDKENIDVFIHLDKKSNIKNKLKNFSNNYFVEEENRIDIQWGTLSMINATLMLIKTMIETNKEYDYVYLISGQDFLIKSIQSLEDFLEKNKNKNFIDIIPYDDSKYKKYLKRVNLYYPNWMVSSNKMKILIKFMYIFITGGLKHNYIKRKNSNNLPFSFGSQWWALQYECVKELYNISIIHPEYLQYYEHSLVPDESYFQTLFEISSYKGTNKNSLTYTNWNGEINHPKTFVLKDFEELQNQNKKFIARKFDENIDCDIIKFLYNKFNNI